MQWGVELEAVSYDEERKKEPGIALQIKNSAMLSIHIRYSKTSLVCSKGITNI